MLTTSDNTHCYSAEHPINTHPPTYSDTITTNMLTTSHNTPPYTKSTPSLWPQDESDVLTKRDVIQDYPELIDI